MEKIIRLVPNMKFNFVNDYVPMFCFSNITITGHAHGTRFVQNGDATGYSILSAQDPSIDEKFAIFFKKKQNNIH